VRAHAITQRRNGRPRGRSAGQHRRCRRFTAGPATVAHPAMGWCPPTSGSWRGPDERVRVRRRGRQSCSRSTPPNVSGPRFLRDGNRHRVFGPRATVSRDRHAPSWAVTPRRDPSTSHPRQPPPHLRGGPSGPGRPDPAGTARTPTSQGAPPGRPPSSGPKVPVRWCPRTLPDGRTGQQHEECPTRRARSENNVGRPP
jgi:hypothetical protein